MGMLTIGKIVSRIAIIIAVTDVIVLLALSSIPHAMHGNKLVTSHAAMLSLLNAFLLIIFASPIIYFWVVKPFVDERNEAMEKIMHFAHYDPLTQIANRRLINQNLKSLMARCIRRDFYGALLLIDLDNFKPINDNYGHDAGDAILIEVAKRLTTAMREEDIVGRIGGDEFVVLISHLDVDEQVAIEKALIIARKLHALVDMALEHQGQTLKVTASIGISLLGAEKITQDIAFKRADMAMYQAKKSSVKHVIFSEREH